LNTTTMDGILFAEKFIENPNELFDFLKQTKSLNRTFKILLH